MSTDPLADGEYPVFVVDATEGDGVVAGIEVTILSGEHKGEVVTVAGAVRGTFVDVIGLPGTLSVLDGVPKLHLER